MSESATVTSQWISEAVSQYEAPLMQYAAKLLRDDEAARDVVQDTFLRLWEADRTAVDGHLAPWLYRVCRNRAVDVMRKEGRMTTLETETLPARPPAATDRAETSKGVFALMADLPARQQEVLRLKFQSGLSYREIATVLDLTVSHVGVLIHNAIKSIREHAGTVGESASRPAPSNVSVTG